MKWNSRSMLGALWDRPLPVQTTSKADRRRRDDLWGGGNPVPNHNLGFLCLKGKKNKTRRQKANDSRLVKKQMTWAWEGIQNPNSLKGERRCLFIIRTLYCYSVLWLIVFVLSRTVAVSVLRHTDSGHVDVFDLLGCCVICGLLGNYTASCGNYLPTFRDNVSAPSSWVKIPR
jgi:hypothetical protein